MVLVDPTQPDACEPVDDVKQWLATHCPDQWRRVETTFPNKVPPGYEILLLSRIKRLEQRLAELPEPKRSRLRRERWGEIDRLPSIEMRLLEDNDTNEIYGRGRICDAELDALARGRLEEA